MRLIDADDLMLKLRRQPRFEKRDFDKSMLYVEKSIIDMQPTIEAEPVKHGRWEKVIPTKSAAKWSNKVSCSICHFAGYTRYNYCPNCGAKMEVEQ